jgi:nucleoside-diphosphate-sugar epimerase
MILITRASGFIGSQHCRLLSTRAYAVVAIDRRFATTRPNSQFSGDIGSSDFLVEVIQRLNHAEYPILQYPAEIGERMIWLST